MKRVVSVMLISILTFVAASYAQAPFLMNYQARLNNNIGNPVPDGDYQITFAIYSDSTGGTLLWSETNPAIHTTNGFFDVNLGSTEPFDDGRSILDIPNPFLQIQVGTEPPMTPRTRITSTAKSAIAERVSGDIQTSVGNLVVQGSAQSVGLHTGTEYMGLVIEERPGDPVYGRSMILGMDASGMNLGFEGPDGATLIEASAASGVGGRASWVMFNPQPEPPGHDPLIEMATETEGNAGLRLYNPRMTEPFDEKVFEVCNNPTGGASMRMFNPQPEPPGSDPFKAFEISTGAGGEASWVMFNPQPEPPGNDPFFILQTDPAGSDMSFFAPQIGGIPLANNHPQIQITSDALASRLLFQRAFNTIGGPADSMGIFMYADSVGDELRFFKGGNVHLKIASTVNGASMKFLDDGSEYMGIEPSPWNPGGSLKMYGTGGLTSLELASDGSASFLHDGSEYMGIEPSPWHAGGDLIMRDATGGQTMLLSSMGNMSIGTSSISNILTVKQYSSTDPIADGWTTYSSRRWKTNIEPLKDPMAKVMALRGVSYDWKETGKHDIGLIAEEVGEVVPEVVTYEKNGIDAQSVDYARLTALLIEAVKEQQRTIEEMKSEISDLKAQSKEHAFSGSDK